MHVAATPVLVEVPVGEPVLIAVTITNTTSLIDAYTVRAFGLDPRWISVSPARQSLFPSEVGMAEVTVALPVDFPAGRRQISVHVQSENDPADFSLAEIALDVGTRARTTMRVDPVTVTGGNAAQFALIVGNEGNATVEARPNGTDPEDVADIRFDPAAVVLPPGRREIIRADVRGGRPWFGQPKPRLLSFDLGAGSPPVMATFLQRPRIGRWLISLLGLVTAAAVFAIVLSTVADRLVDEAGVDDQLLNAALADPSAGGGEQIAVSPATVSGQVVAASTGEGIAGVQAELFSSGDGTVALASAATDSGGTYAFGRLSAGRYRIRFTGAGFDEQWYDGSVTFADATDVDVAAGQPVALPPLQLGGRPGSVTGKVVADDPTGADARLVVAGLTDGDADALVEEVAVSADGSFQFESVPSPATYQLVVEKTGFATEVRDVVLEAAEQLDGVEVVLREADGEVTGRVQSPTGPLGGVTVTATDGTLEVTTVSLTLDDVGAFAVRALPEPGQYTLTFERDGFRTESRTVSLTGDQAPPSLTVDLQPTTGTISGTVSEVRTGPVGGVTVTVSGGEVEVSTTTASTGAVGTYSFDSLPAPATYTVSFAKPGLVGQTRREDLDPSAGRGDLRGIDAQLVPATAVVGGVVRDATGSPVAGADVLLTDGTDELRSRSAHDPPGRFEFSDLEPGAYTVTASLPGTTPSVVLVNVLAADVAEVPIDLGAQASLFGRVELADPETGEFAPFPGVTVRLFLAPDFPANIAQAVDTATTDALGTYEFVDLPAPEDFVVAVYATATTPDALDAELVQTLPGRPFEVPPFRLRQAT